MNSEETSIDPSEEPRPQSSFFFDTYAFFEILKGNESYEPYKTTQIVTTKLNVFELYLGIAREHEKETAMKLLDTYYPFAIDFDKEVIQKAAALKIEMNKRDVSMTDCVGYSLAQQLGIKFLTGDQAFEKLTNVEFVR